ncbi:hypothetical protein GIW56_03840 [Pseudomonas gessardii]|uniref:Uncharacterized protein n=1 Tax=Pseudomonas gessardii TaxID=78544 RepID=A0ABS9F0N3_9PSED|nr:hypothetical protein [Pseudomonas gessardii]MCF4988913.1 hypothetical protein [Pseudomonas gessardii]MCF5084227.1 hypothetical protein [Pseudomonas gessardii]MCF5105961.1 hypothetical protein [Pseudomonas gessardii]NNA89549.1 hypothetical protein [Pseudomonas gessardii]
MAVITASLFLLLCGVRSTVVLSMGVVEEVFSGLIAGHKKAGLHLSPAQD